MRTETDVCIIGAGLSGLALASALRTKGRDVTVLEARDRPSGRVLSHNGHDLGPSWIGIDESSPVFVKAAVRSGVISYLSLISPEIVIDLSQDSQNRSIA